jgi:hypothetical protein
MRDCWGEQWEAGWEKERVLMGKRMRVRCIYSYGDSRMKPSKHCLKKGERRKGEWGGGLVQGTLYRCTESHNEIPSYSNV